LRRKWTDRLYIFTILLFALGFFNIIFAWIGFACMIIPFALLAKDGKKTWCQGYCPRANLYTVLFKGKGKNARAAHLSFRVYSMMFTTTVIGLLFGFVYKPRTWCMVCPVNTISDMVIK
jgi:polyferredoxin